LPTLLAFAVAISAGLALLPTTTPQLLFSDEGRLRTFDLAGLVPALVLSGSLCFDLGETEYAARKALRLSRGVHVLLLLLATIPMVLSIAWRSDASIGLSSWLNCCALLGLVLVMATEPFGVPIWLPVLLLAGLTYLLGTHENGSGAQPWAFLLWEAGAGRNITDIAVLLLGAVVFVFGPRAGQN
jgi:hypothetical protein